MDSDEEVIKELSDGYRLWGSMKKTMSLRIFPFTTKIWMTRMMDVLYIDLYYFLSKFSKLLLSRVSETVIIRWNIIAIVVNSVED